MFRARRPTMRLSQAGKLCGSACAAVGVCDVVGVLIGVDDGCIRESLAGGAEPVAGLEGVAERGLVAGGGALGNPEHAHAVDELRVVLVEFSGDFRVHVLGQCLKRLCLFTTGFIALMSSRPELNC